MSEDGDAGSGDENPDDGDEDVSSDEGKSKILKDVKFPEVEKERNPLNSAVSVSKCIGKRVDKLTEEILKLQKIDPRNEIQQKFLRTNSCPNT